MPLGPLGFPAQATQARLASLTAELRERSETAQREMVTGRHADTAAALHGQVGEVLRIEKSLADLEQYSQTIGLAEARTSSTQTALGHLDRLTNDLAGQAQIALQNGTSDGLETMSEQARQALESAVGALNTRFGGRALFGGDGGQTAALADADTILAGSAAVLTAAPSGGTGYADLATAFNSPGALFETSFYLGGTGDAPEAEIAPGERVAYHARADEQPVRDLLRNLAALAAAYDPSNALGDAERRAIAEQGLDGLRETVQPMTAVAARIGSAEARIATIKARNTATEASLTLSLDSLTGREDFEAATRLKSIEGQLETLFLTTARFSDLSLANFLR